jgi:allantoate deiminase
MSVFAERITSEQTVRDCRQLAQYTEDAGRTTRTFLSPPMKDVHRVLSDRMRDLGMRVWLDAAGNLRGLHGDPGAPRLMIGSHLDTVPGAGPFDGILGVVMGIRLAATRPRLALEIIGFSEEEGVRFGFPFIGSRALAGNLGASDLARCDPAGVSVEQAIRNYGLEPSELNEAKLAPNVIAYLEFHIEQGPVLDQAELPLGIVDAIVGQSRLSLAFEGKANHAGTTPMDQRQDALAAAAEWITAVERLARATPGLAATVGSLNVSPNAGNVIAGFAEASLDVRHASGEVRAQSVNALLDAASAISTRRGVSLRHETKLNQAAVPMDTRLCETLARAVAEAGYPVRRMTSGAGHDAMILAPCVPSAMLFIRSPGGISHHPDEDVRVEDVNAAFDAGRRFIAALEAQYA